MTSAVQCMSHTEPMSKTLDSPRAETILVVDDEEPVRYVIRDVLERRGYRVLVAGDGASALRVSSDFHEDIHLLVTDVVMPRINGVEMAKSLTVHRPSLKVLYMSGHTERIVFDRERIQQPSRHFLRKPFQVHTFVEKIREVLADPATITSAVPSEPARLPTHQ